MNSLLRKIATADDASRQRFCRTVLVVGVLGMMASTWRLWLPMSDFPRIPLIGIACRVPELVEWMAVGAMLAALARTLRSDVESTGFKAAGMTVVPAMILLIILNQHRLLPWVWFFGFALVATLGSSERCSGRLRWLVCSVYVFSGWSKLEPGFTGGGGLWLLDGLLSAVGLSADDTSPAFQKVSLVAMPVTELVAGVCIAVSGLRRVGLVIAGGMHTALLLALGPLGLQHEPAVLIWNAMFLVLLFPILLEMMSTSNSDGRRSVTAVSVVLFAASFVLPVFGQRGIERMDQWPCWVLYASWPERATVFVHNDEVDKLPPDLLKHIADPLAVDDWRQLRLDRWSIAAVGTPIYPQNRFRIAVASAAFAEAGIERFRIRCESAAGTNGRREVTILNGPKDVGQFQRECVLNLEPRRRTFPLP